MPGVPDWRDGSFGGRARVALWLLAEVGEGSAFTKAMLREAFPGVEQIDRRMRDLRAAGWVIDTAREDASLSVNELRFVTRGTDVWLPGRGATIGLSARQRADVLRRDGFACVHCGTPAGEEHPDRVGLRARLSVTQHRGHRAQPGETPVVRDYITQCDRCRAGSVTAPEAADIVSHALNLESSEQQVLLDWLAEGRRRARGADLVWAECQHLSQSERPALVADLEQTLRAQGESPQ